MLAGPQNDDVHPTFGVTSSWPRMAGVQIDPIAQHIFSYQVLGGE